MAIQASEKPPMTVKETLSHLAIVTVGILIALSLESLVEWGHHRSQVRETRANLTSEIRANKTELDGVLSRVGLTKMNLTAAIDFARALATGKKPTATSLQLGFEIAELQASSRTTAEITGVFGYMDYDEVSRYAALYDRQTLFQTVQAQVQNETLSAIGAIQGVPDPTEPANFSTAQIEDWLRHLRAALGSLTVLEQFGRKLSVEYEQQLASP